MESGLALFVVEKEVVGLSVEPNIRAIDLRKLRKAIDQNSVVLRASAEDLHSTIKRVKSTALEAISILEALSERADLQEKVLQLQLEGSKDPAEVWRRQERDIRTLIQACLVPYSPSVDYQ